MTDTVRVFAFISLCLLLAFIGFVGDQIVKRKHSQNTNDQMVETNSLEGEH